MKFSDLLQRGLSLVKVGQEVAVKAQYPDIAASVEMDKVRQNGYAPQTVFEVKDSERKVKVGITGRARQAVLSYGEIPGR